MAATIIDSRIFGNIFSTDAMRNVWSDENRTAKYIEIEKALAIVQGRLGIIPAQAAQEIVRNCDPAKFDLNKLRAETERIGSGARHDRRGRGVPRAGRRHAGQDLDGRQADDADRGG